MLKSADAGVDVARGIAVEVRRDDGGPPHAAVALEAPGRAGRPGGSRPRMRVSRARRDRAVDVVAADPLVEVEELVGGDRPGVQRSEPVLHADVVERSTGEAGRRVDAELVAVGVREVAADPVRVRRRVVDRASFGIAGSQPSVGSDAAEEGPDPEGARSPGLVAADRGLLRGGERRARRCVEK